METGCRQGKWGGRQQPNGKLFHAPRMQVNRETIPDKQPNQLDTEPGAIAQLKRE